VDWTWGRNQPTGLAVSPDGRSVAFSNFLDDDIEVYAFSPDELLGHGVGVGQQLLKKRRDRDPQPRPHSS
jgi:DNA-binding beta-propeller fold protein YncE